MAASLVAACLIPAAASGAPPPNDDFADAAVLGPALPVAVDGTNAEATGEPGETSHTGIPANPPPNSSVWYRWTPAENHPNAILDICDNAATPPSIFVDLAVYTGTAVNALGAPIVQGGGFSDGPGGCKVTFNATAGTTYRIAVNFYKDQGIATFTLRLRDPSPPANDAYPNAQAVGPALPVSVPATTIDATTQGSEPAALGGSGGRSVWFKWTPSASGLVRVDACDWEPRSGDSNRAIGVYTDTNATLPVGATIAEDGDSCQVDFNAVSGQEYRIAFSGPVFGEGDFTFRIRSAVAPSNDNFANAIVVGPGLPVSVQGLNDFAGEQAGEPSHGGGGNDRSVWYRWTPTATEAGIVAINACVSDPDSAFTPDLGVYTGAAVNSLTSVGLAPGGFSPYCFKLLNAVAGTTYRIAVSSSNSVGDEGAFTLDIHRPDPPANDDFADAAAVGPALPVAVQGTIVDATEQEAGGETNHSGFNEPIHSVWFRWTAPVDETATFDVCDATFASAISVYEGTALGELDRLAVDSEDGCGEAQPFGSRVALPVDAGQTYLIAVDTLRPGYWGGFTLRINGPSGTPVDPPPGGQPPDTGTKPPVIEPPFNLSKALKKCRKKFRPGKQRAKCVRKARKRAKS